MTLQGHLTTLYSFCAQSNCTDGFYPFGGLVQGTDGYLYGAATDGGIGYGTLFKVTTSGTLTTLHTFNLTDGGYPEAALVQATDGNFYGTTPGGGANGFGGTLFVITSAGDLKTLYNFCSETNCGDGIEPVSGLMQATDGALYGVTSAGGTSSRCSGGCGTAFRFATGLRPFVETRLSSGRPGARVIVLGSGLTARPPLASTGRPLYLQLCQARRSSPPSQSVLPLGLSP